MRSDTSPVYHFETTYVVNCVVNFLELGLTDANLTHFERSYVVICVVNLLELVKFTPHFVYVHHILVYLYHILR